jgi:NADH-quinone oxidoreductase subunit N
MTFSYLFANNIKLAIPEIFLACSIISILMFGCFTSFTKFYKYPIISLNTGYLLILVFLFSSFLIINNPLIFGTAFNGCFIVDWLSIMSKTTILISSIACLLISMDYINFYKINSFEYFIIVGLSVFGQLILISSCDFVMAYIALEIQSFCFYIMAAFKRDSAHSTEAGLKYFLLGSFSSTLLLFGLSLIYGSFGTTSFCNLGILLFEIVDLPILSYFGFALIFVGLLFKLAAAPFHI